MHVKEPRRGGVESQARSHRPAMCSAPPLRGSSIFLPPNLGLAPQATRRRPSGAIRGIPLHGSSNCFLINRLRHVGPGLWGMS